MKRNSSRLSKFILPVLFILGVVLGFWFVVTSPIFLVRTIVISGQPDIFSDLTFLNKKRNLILMSTKDVETDLQKNQYVKVVQITKQYPETLFIQVNEREPLALLNQQNVIGLADREGFILPKLARFNKHDFAEIICEQIPGGAQKIEQLGVLQALALMDELQGANLKVKNIICTDETTATLTIDHTEILINNQTPVGRQASSLLFLLKQFRIEGKQPEKIDLRFDKPVLTPEITQPVATESG